DDEVGALVGDEGRWEAALRHDRIPFLSYPYEWPFEMLKDAALLQLELTRQGLDEGVITKDATSYNVQFVGARPTFIDVGSFEKLRDGQPWYGDRQFCELFLYPLMLQAYKDLPFQPWLRGAIDGITPAEARALMSFRDRFRKGVFSQVVLRAALESRYADTDTDVKKELGKAGLRKEVLVANVDKLIKLVRRLQWKRSESTWSGYSERGHYTDEDLDGKTAFVDAVVGRTHRSLVWDLGANDGHFSRLAAKNSDYVVAVDADPLVVDTLYRALREEGNTTILPLTMDLSSPSPGLGWRGAERKAFVDRTRPDVVLCLAVIHHLAITNNVPLPEFVAFLADVGAEAVLEFPTPDDQMVKRLLKNKREGTHDDYTATVLERALDEHFDVVERTTLPSGTRILYHLTPR
ncbi:MAG: class I SAM-dependent methyltransferase, partial [Acidimicrobiales bacterium]|nr:class I SAM-dependent methyltransferase [Acidimicrobiales bacterium]